MSPTRRRPRVAVVAIALGACGQAAAPTPAALPAGLPDDHVLLRVDEYGGRIGCGPA